MDTWEQETKPIEAPSSSKKRKTQQDTRPGMKQGNNITRIRWNKTQNSPSLHLLKSFWNRIIKIKFKTRGLLTKDVYHLTLVVFREITRNKKLDSDVEGRQVQMNEWEWGWYKAVNQGRKPETETGAVYQVWVKTTPEKKSKCSWSEWVK